QDTVGGAGGAQGQFGRRERHQRTVGVATGGGLAEPAGAGIFGAGGRQGDGAPGALGDEVAFEVGVDGRRGQEQPAAGAPPHAGGGGGAAPGEIGRDGQGQ